MGFDKSYVADDVIAASSGEYSLSGRIDGEFRHVSAKNIF